MSDRVGGEEGLKKAVMLLGWVVARSSRLAS
jgi:hypothetical protein